MSTHLTSGDEGFSPFRIQRTTGKLLATQGYVVGIEIGGSGSRQSVALADLDGNILHRVRRSLDYVPDTDAVLQHLNDMVHEVVDQSEHLNEGRILRVGVAVGGLVDPKMGLVQTLHHTHGWRNFPLQDYFAERLMVPCIVDNNANAAALAEVVRGEGVGERVVLYVGLGRGIGGGLVVNGRIYHGTTCTAGEIGHMLVKENGTVCSCGGRGHLETIASARAILRTVHELAVEYPGTQEAIARITGGDVQKLTAEQVFQLAAQGDRIAQHVVEDVYTYLGIALANIVQIVNPGMIILGGPVALAKDHLILPLRERIREYCLPGASQSLRLVPSRLGSEANLVGAVTLALQDL